MINIKGVDKAELLKEIFNVIIYREGMINSNLIKPITYAEARKILAKGLFVATVNGYHLNLDLAHDEIDEKGLDLDVAMALNGAMHKILAEKEFADPDNEYILLMGIKMCEYWLNRFSKDELDSQNMIRDSLKQNHKLGISEELYRRHFQDEYLPNFREKKIHYCAKKANLEKRLKEVYVKKAMKINLNGNYEILSEEAFANLGKLEDGYLVLARALGIDFNLSEIYSQMLQNCNNLYTKMYYDGGINHNVHMGDVISIIRNLTYQIEFYGYSFTLGQLQPIFFKAEKALKDVTELLDYYFLEGMMSSEAKELNAKDILKLIDTMEQRKMLDTRK